MATLNPSPDAPSLFVTGMRQSAKRSVASGCGAMTSSPRHDRQPGRVRIDDESGQALGPLPSPVRAKTT